MEDLPFIVKLYNSTIAGRMVTAEDHEVSVESRYTWFNSFNPKTRPLWIILIGDESIGWLGYSSFYGRPAYKHTAEISMYLDENYRGKGYGSLALKLALTKAPDYNIKVVLAFIFLHNLPSQIVFKKTGFSVYGTLPKVAELDGRMLDLVILGRSLV